MSIPERPAEVGEEHDCLRVLAEGNIGSTRSISASQGEDVLKLIMPGGKRCVVVEAERLHLRMDPPPESLRGEAGE